MRRFIYQMVHGYDTSTSNKIYKWFMIFVVLLSILPLTVKGTNGFLWVLDAICLCVFVVDYFLRWITADYRLNNHHWTSFVRFPFRLLSIIDLLSIISLITSVFHLTYMYNIVVWLKVFRIVRIFKYSKNMRTIMRVLENSKKALIAVGGLSVGYVVISALIIFNVEPQSFDTFFDAIYWATISLTTVGYGDIYPVTVIGRVVAMLSSFLGIAVVALPAGIVTAEYIKIVKPEE